MAIRVKLPTGEIGEFPDDMPHEEIEAVLRQQFPPTEADSASSVPESSAPKESTGWKALGQDALQLLGDTLKGGVGLLKRSPGNIKEIGSELINHPLSYPPHIAQQVLASLGEIGKGTLNLPHEAIAELGRKELIPEWAAKYNELPFTHIPEDTGVEKFLGLESTKKSDELLRALPALYGGGQLVGKGISKAKKAVNPPDLKQAIRDTQAKVNEQNKITGKIFDHVDKEVEARGISKVTIDRELIDQARELLSKTLANKKLFEKANKGDFEALRKVQGDLRNKGEKGLSSDDLANNDLGELMLETRDEINGSIQKHLENTGHHDLAKALNKARKDYRQLQQTYHSTNKLSKTFGKDQLVPHDPITLLREESTQMNRFMEAHPELEKALAKALTHKKKMKKLGTIGKIGATVGGIKGAEWIIK